jgi:SET domain-containing protein
MRTQSVIDHALDRDLIRVGKSRIDGRGVFAKRKIPKGARIIEYKGKRRPTPDFVPEGENGEPARVYVFALREGVVIDPEIGGNEARFINHSCEPNCEIYKFKDRAYVYAQRAVARGEELTFDYQLRKASGAASNKADAKKYACNCGSKKCRGTMLAGKRQRSI